MTTNPNPNPNPEPTPEPAGTRPFFNAAARRIKYVDQAAGGQIEASLAVAEAIHRLADVAEAAARQSKLAWLRGASS